MAEKEFVVLYTHQKTKKAKTWQDGVLKLNLTSSRGVLYDDNGRKLDTVFIKNVQNVISEELESDRYLIQVEEEKPSAAGSSAVIKHTTRADSVTTNSVISLGNQRSNSLQHTSSLLRTGLKRKRSGFIPPRQIKQLKEVEEPAPSADQAVTPSPPRLCPEAARPPALFGAIGHKSSLLTLYADRRKKLDTDGQVARLQPPSEPQQPAKLSVLHQNQYSSKSNQCDTDWHNGRLKTDRSASYSSREQINESGIISTDVGIEEQHTTSDNSDVTAKRSASQILALIGGKSKKQNLLLRVNSREHMSQNNITSNLQNVVQSSTKGDNEVNTYLLKSDNFSTELDNLDLSVNKVSTNDFNKSEDKRLCRVDENNGMSSSSFSETCSSKHAPDYSLESIIQENLISCKNKSDTTVSAAADFTVLDDKPKNQIKEDSNSPDVPISNSFQSADNCDTILALGNMDFNTPSSSVILNPGDHLSDSNYPNNSTSCDLMEIQKDISDNLKKVDDDEDEEVEEEEEEACFDINLSPFSQSDNSLWDDIDDTDLKASPGTSCAAPQESVENNETSTSDLTNSKSSQNICSSDIDVDTSKLNEHFSDSNNSCEESDVNRTEIRKETRGDGSVIGDMNVKGKSSNSQQVLLLTVPEVTDSKNEGPTINYHHKGNLISGREVKDHLDSKTEAYQEISTIHGNAARNDPDLVADMECHELGGATERVDEYGNYTTLNKIEKLCVSSENVCERVTVCYETDGESAITGHMKKDRHYSEKTGEMLNANNYVDLDFSPEIPVHLELLKNTLKADHMQMSSEEIHPSSDLMEGNNFDFYQKHQPNKTLRSNSSRDGFSSLNHKRENTLAQSPEFTDNEHYGAISGEVHNLFQNSANFDPGGGLNEQSDWHEEPSVINVEDPATDRLPFLSQITRSSCSTRMNKKPDIDLSKRKDSFIVKSSRDPQERITGKLAPSQMKCASGSSLPHPSDAFKGQDATVRLDSFYQRTPKDFLAAANAKLHKHTVKGSMKGETARRSPMHVVPVDEYVQAELDEDDSCTADTDNQVSLADCQEMSLYWLDANAGKNQFDHESMFITTPKDFLEPNKNGSSPCQEVPISCVDQGSKSPEIKHAFLPPQNYSYVTNKGKVDDSRNQVDQDSGHISRDHKREPLRTNPFDDPVQYNSYTCYQNATNPQYSEESFSISDENENGSPLHDQLNEQTCNRTSDFVSGKSPEPDLCVMNKPPSRWERFKNSSTEDGETADVSHEYHSRFSPQDYNKRTSNFLNSGLPGTEFFPDSQFEKMAKRTIDEIDTEWESPLEGLSASQHREFTPISETLQMQQRGHDINPQVSIRKERQNLAGPRKALRGRGFKPPSFVKDTVSPIQGRFQTSAMSVSSPIYSEVDMKNELQFPGKMELEMRTEPCCRKAVIPSTFLNVQEYKQALCAALNEHINTLFCDLARNYHTALAKVDISKYVPNLKGKFGSVKSNHNPSCEHGLPSKMVQVKKEGPNQGRYFFACDESRENQCKFFKWADQLESGSSRKPGGGEAGPECSKLQLSDADSISTYFKGQNISLYCGCQLVRKTQQDIRAHFFKSKPWQKKYKNDDENCSKKKLFLKLTRRENSSAYTKDDVWVISRNLNFEPNSTFLAKSVFYGPSAENEIEVEPMSRFSPSNWSNEVMCYALHANNIANELACLYNITEHVNTTLPLLPSLLNRDMCSRINRGGFQTPGQTLKNNIFIPLDLMMEIAEEHITKYRLNEDQATSLRNVASMFNTDSSKTPQAFTLIHGVFGAGKSFLLAVVVLFLVRMFELNDSYTPGVPVPMKLLISSTTNVAVDRILQGLLDLKFDEFIRVGSVKKIAKPVLPYSVHAAGSKSQELKELQEMLKGDITPSEKHYVRKSIEKLRLGENKKKLGVVRVVGVTCAAASFSCMAGMTFSVVLLDECSQMTEPASLLPIAKFECEKLVLVGDPKQLSPTIGGFESLHDQGLEQTLFDRLVKMGHVPIMLRTQYRCHPVISGIANSLFYDGQLMDGITEADRQHLAPELPTLAFYDVCDGQECYDKYASYYNIGEAEFIVDLIDGLLLSGVEPQMIGVITLYKSQLQKIKAVLQSSKLVENSELQAIQVSTVDAFQGGEKGVIILSCVRTRYVGFIDSDKRTNVALTRSKSHLLIVGHLQNLSRNGLWGKVIQYCRAIPDGIQNVEVTKNHIKDLKIRLESKLESNQAESGSSSSRKKNKDQKKRAFTSLPGGQTSQTPPPSSGSFSGNFEWQPVNVEQAAELTFTPDTAADEEMHSSQASSSPPHQPTVLSRRRPSHQLDTGLYQTQQPEQLSDDEDLPDVLHR